MKTKENQNSSEENKKFGGINIMRSIMEWEWYQDHKTLALFLHCLLKANWRDKKWKGTTIPAGSFITSSDKLATELGLSRQNIRTCLDKLKKSKNLTIKSTNKYTMLTICNYEDYQGRKTYDKPKSTSKSTSPLTSPLTTTNKVNKENNINKKRKVTKNSNSISEKNEIEKPTSLNKIDYESAIKKSREMNKDNEIQLAIPTSYSNQSSSINKSSSSSYISSAREMSGPSILYQQEKEIIDPRKEIIFNEFKNQLESKYKSEINNIFIEEETTNFINKKGYVDKLNIKPAVSSFVANIIVPEKYLISEYDDLFSLSIERRTEIGEEIFNVCMDSFANNKLAEQKYNSVIKNLANQYETIISGYDRDIFIKTAEQASINNFKYVLDLIDDYLNNNKGYAPIYIMSRFFLFIEDRNS